MRMDLASVDRTVPIFLSSFTNRSRTFFASPSSIAILTWTSLVLIRSTTTPNLSSVPNIPAKKPWETLFRFELTFNTMICSLIVTAVGRRLRCESSVVLAKSWRDRGAVDKSLGRSESRSGWITVPPPRGFWTFFIRIGTLRRMTCRKKSQQLFYYGNEKKNFIPAPLWKDVRLHCHNKSVLPLHPERWLG